jgi:transposase
MKTSKWKDRREYNAGYREQAVRYWQESGQTAEAIGGELGVGALALYRWKAEVKKQAAQSPPPGVGANAAAEELLQLRLEVKRLRQENARLLEQREILKKATGILSETPPSGMPPSKS